MLDYLEVKKFHAEKLRDDAEGSGRVESAFYHTMKMVYLKGVEDGMCAERHAPEAWGKIVGIDDRRDPEPREGETWLVLLPGATTCTKQRVARVSPYSVGLYDPARIMQIPSHYPRDSIRFIEKVAD